jgi:hypothetical protein
MIGTGNDFLALHAIVAGCFNPYNSINSGMIRP